MASETYMDIACSVEMIHTYSLIHDDLPAMDDDDLRRGKLTVHKAFDEATAILAGDALLTEAFKVITKNQHTKDDQKVALIHILSSCAGSKGMVYGQMLDLENENKPPVLETLETIHFHKTAKLIQAPLMMASILANKKDLKIWESIGYHLGMAFQIQDDLLELTSNEQEMGKTLSDSRNEKVTYVQLLGLNKATKIVEDHFKVIHEKLNHLEFDQKPIIELVNMMQFRKK